VIEGTCSNCTSDGCMAAFNSSACGYSPNAECGDIQTTDDWNGDWQIQEGSNCLMENGKLVGDCLPVCDIGQCNCLLGTVHMTIDNTSTNGTRFWVQTDVQLMGNGTRVTVADWFYVMGTGGIVMTGNWSDLLNGTMSGEFMGLGVYDVENIDGTLTFNVRQNTDCNQSAIRDPGSSNFLLLGLLLGGVGLLAMILVWYCCCRRKKKTDQGESIKKGINEPDNAPYAVLPSETPRGGRY